jgi:predicted kinase
MHVRYPRTPHLPWSPGATADDVRAGDLSGLRGREVVVTEKLDGENTTIYADGVHARSLDSAHHPSRTWVKALQGRIGGRIPPGWRVCGENLFARHSIEYKDLDSWFYGFSVWDGDHCLDWDQTVRFLRRLGVPSPPVLWRGTFDERVLRRLKLDTARQEGYVVRAVDGFGRPEFGEQVAKWVRPSHVESDTHWMHAAVVENGLGLAAPLWAVRTGAAADVRSLLAAVGLTAESSESQVSAEAADAVVAEVSARLDALGRSGDVRLAGVLAALLHDRSRTRLMAGLSGSLGLPLARRVADLVGLHTRLHQPFPDEDRRAGLVRMSFAADLGVLHAVARAVLIDSEVAGAHEQVDWSALHAEDAGLLGEAPLEPLRAGLREALSGLEGDAADRCWAQTREAFADKRIASVAVEEAVAASWQWRSGDFPRLIHLVGPSGSGKSIFAAKLAGIGIIDTAVSLDELREARGSRTNQRANSEVLTEGLDRLDAALAGGGTVVWDATSLNSRQRSLVHAVARRRDALTTHAVILVDEDELIRRNSSRADSVSPEVLVAQLRRFVPPYPGEAHRTWYVGRSGDIEDVDGVLDGEED